MVIRTRKLALMLTDKGESISREKCSDSPSKYSPSLRFPDIGISVAAHVAKDVLSMTIPGEHSARSPDRLASPCALLALHFAACAIRGASDSLSPDFIVIGRLDLLFDAGAWSEVGKVAQN